MQIRIVLFSILLVLSFSPTAELKAQLFEKGLESYHERDYKKAKKHLTSAFWKNQNFAAAYYLGEIHRKHFDFSKAIEWHRIAMDNKVQVSFWGYCLSLMQEGRVQDAKRFAKQKLLLNPNDKDLPNIIAACERLERKVPIEDSVRILDPNQANHYFHHKSFKEHSDNEIYHLQKPKYTFSSIYHDDMDSSILRQEPEFYGAVGTLKGYGTKLKGAPMSYYILDDGADVSYLVYPDFLKEHQHDNHYNGVENYYVEVSDGEISSIEGSKIFKNDRSIKYPSISADGKTMIFSTNKLRDSYGGYDLYKSVYRFPNWTNPENLGPKVNTMGDEIYPFIAHNDKLYFSSDGLGAFGDQDIFVTSMVGYKIEDARPLDSPVNSRFDDFAYIVNSMSGLGMFLSNRAQKAHPDEFFFQKIFSDCSSEKLFDSLPQEVECNDDRFCVKLDVLKGTDLGDVKLGYEWDMGDGTILKGPQTSYCYKEAGLFKGSVRFNSMAKKGDLIEQSFPLEFDLRNREELIVKISNYRMSTILSARNSKCNGCEDVNYYWKIGNSRYKCGPLIELFNPSRNTPYTVVMEFKKRGKQQRVVCEGKL